MHPAYLYPYKSSTTKKFCSLFSRHFLLRSMLVRREKTFLKPSNYLKIIYTVVYGKGDSIYSFEAFVRFSLLSFLKASNFKTAANGDLLIYR